MPRDSSSYGNHWLYLKVAAMSLLCFADLCLNSSLEFDDYVGDVKNLSSGANVLVLLFGFQIVVQISTFLALFLMMGDTYLFRVGLLGVLASKFSFVLFLHPFYMLYTVIIGAYRVQHMITDTPIDQLWTLPFFTPLSVTHKIVAAIYYVANLRSSIKLGSPMYYTKDAWVDLYYNSNRDTSSLEQSKSLLRRRNRQS